MEKFLKEQKEKLESEIEKLQTKLNTTNSLLNLVSCDKWSEYHKIEQFLNQSNSVLLNINDDDKEKLDMELYLKYHQMYSQVEYKGNLKSYYAEPEEHFNYSFKGQWVAIRVRIYDDDRNRYVMEKYLHIHIKECNYEFDEISVPAVIVDFIKYPKEIMALVKYWDHENKIRSAIVPYVKCTTIHCQKHKIWLYRHAFNRFIKIVKKWLQITQNRTYWVHIGKKRKTQV